MANKKEALKKKMVKIELGEKKKRDFGYRVEDHKGNILKEGGKKF